MREKDISQKQFFEDEVRFADLMNAVCFHGRQVLKPEELEASTISVLKADEQAVVERFCDVVKKQTKDGAIYAIYVLENQETVDYGMLVRVMLEESIAYDRQAREKAKKNRNDYRRKFGTVELMENTTQQAPAGEGVEEQTLTDGEFLYGFRKSDRLTPIYTIVVYWGDKEWDAAKSLRELVELPVEDEELRAEMLEMLPDYKIKVYDLNKETDFTAFQTSLKTVFEFYSNRSDRKELRDYMESHKEEVEELDRESKFFLATMLGQKKLRNELLKKNEKEQEERSMCKAIDDMLEESLNEGLKQGLQQGRAESEELITELRKELTEVKEKSNCKAIDDMLEESWNNGLEKGRAESEALIAELRKELAEVKKKNMALLIQENESLRKQLAEIG